MAGASPAALLVRPQSQGGLRWCLLSGSAAQTACTRRSQPAMSRHCSGERCSSAHGPPRHGCDRGLVKGRVDACQSAGAGLCCGEASCGASAAACLPLFFKLTHALRVIHKGAVLKRGGGGQSKCWVQSDVFLTGRGRGGTGGRGGGIQGRQVVGTRGAVAAAARLSSSVWRRGALGISLLVARAAGGRRAAAAGRGLQPAVCQCAWAAWLGERRLLPGDDEIPAWQVGGGGRAGCMVGAPSCGVCKL